MFVLLALIFTLSSAANAQGLVGVVSELRLGASDEQTVRADRAYDSLRLIVLGATGLVAIFAVRSSRKLMRKNGKSALPKAILLAVSPSVGTYLTANVVINNLWRWL